MNKTQSRVILVNMLLLNIQKNTILLTLHYSIKINAFKKIILYRLKVILYLNFIKPYCQLKHLKLLHLHNNNFLKNTIPQAINNYFRFRNKFLLQS